MLAWHTGLTPVLSAAVSIQVHTYTFMYCTQETAKVKICVAFGAEDWWGLWRSLILSKINSPSSAIPHESIDKIYVEIGLTKGQNSSAPAFILQLWPMFSDSVPQSGEHLNNLIKMLDLHSVLLRAPRQEMEEWCNLGIPGWPVWD